MAQLPLDQGIPRFKQNEERVDIFANGNEATDWTTSDGQVVPSLRKFLKELRLTYEQPGFYFTETDAQMATLSFGPDVNLMTRMPTTAAAGDVAPADDITWWKRDSDPGSKPYFTTADGGIWTQVGYVQQEILSALQSAISAFSTGAIFANPTLNGLVTGTAVTQGSFDRTTGRLAKVGDPGIGGAVNLSGTPSLYARRLPPGNYSYAANSVSGGPESSAWSHVLQVLELNSTLDAKRGKVYISFRKPTSDSSQARMWIGVENNTAETIDWLPMPLGMVLQVTNTDSNPGRVVTTDGAFGAIYSRALLSYSGDANDLAAGTRVRMTGSPGAGNLNLPAAGTFWFAVDTMASILNNMLYQVATVLPGSSTTTPDVHGVYMRHRNGTTWGPWVAIDSRSYGLGQAISLTASDNLDNITTAGFYYNSTAGNTAGNNYPVSSAGSLLHQTSGVATSGAQFYTTYGTGMTYVRAKGAGGAWSAWVRLDPDRGSNGNGEYVRFGDGTMICTRRVNLGSILAEGGGTWANPYRTAAFTATFAAQFIAPPTVSLSFPVTGSLAVPERAFTPSGFDVLNTGVSALRVARMGGSNADVEVICDITAIGKWK